MNQYGYAYDPQGLGFPRTVEDYGYTPRKRNSLHPAIRSRSRRGTVVELRRVRYEITSRSKNAVVLSTV